MSGSEPQHTLPYGDHPTVPLHFIEATATEPMPYLEPKPAPRALPDGGSPITPDLSARKRYKRKPPPEDPMLFAVPEVDEEEVPKGSGRDFRVALGWSALRESSDENWLDRPLFHVQWTFLLDWPKYKAQRLYADWRGQPELYRRSREDDMEPFWWFLGLAGRFTVAVVALLIGLTVRAARWALLPLANAPTTRATMNPTDGQTVAQKARIAANAKVMRGFGDWKIAIVPGVPVLAIGLVIFGWPPDFSHEHIAATTAHPSPQQMVQSLLLVGIFTVFFIVWNALLKMRQRRVLYLKFLSRKPIPFGKAIVIAALVLAGLHFGPGIWAWANLSSLNNPAPTHTVTQTPTPTPKAVHKK